MLKKGDIILIVMVLAAVFVGYSWTKLNNAQGGGYHSIAVIKQGDRVVREIDLDAVKNPERITVGGEYDEVILVEKGRIRFEEADCPDLVCVKTGWLTEKGQVAACVPNRTIIKIEGESDKVDGVTY